MRISPNFQAGREPNAAKTNVGHLGNLAEDSSRLTKQFNEVSAKIATLPEGLERDSAVQLKNQLAILIEGLDDEMLAQGKAAAELIDTCSLNKSDEFQGSKTQERA